MSCENRPSNGGGDSLEGNAGGRPFDSSSTAWLVGQCVRYLNTCDKEGELAYLRLVDVLRGCSKDLLETVIALFRNAQSGDAPLRWNLLYVLGDAGNAEVADFLVRTALERLPEANSDQGCEGTRAMEMLVCTMAVHAIGHVAARHRDAADALMKVISARPAQPILIEAVKVAAGLGLGEKARELLPKEYHWIFDIRRARTEEVFADPERQDGKERGFTPPKSGALYTAPQTACCASRER